jgi:hypothetical protein
VKREANAWNSSSALRSATAGLGPIERKLSAQPAVPTKRLKPAWAAQRKGVKRARVEVGKPVLD